jgi:hypothetical protein
MKFASPLINIQMPNMTQVSLVNSLQAILSNISMPSLNLTPFAISTLLAITFYCIIVSIMNHISSLQSQIIQYNKESEEKIKSQESYIQQNKELIEAFQLQESYIQQNKELIERLQLQESYILFMFTTIKSVQEARDKKIILDDMYNEGKRGTIIIRERQKAIHDYSLAKNECSKRFIEFTP